MNGPDYFEAAQNILRQADAEEEAFQAPSNRRRGTTYEEEDRALAAHSAHMLALGALASASIQAAALAQAMEGFLAGAQDDGVEQNRRWRDLLADGSPVSR